MNMLSRIDSDPLGLFVPAASPAERKLRQRLRTAQTLASARATGASSDEARMLYWLVSTTAAAWVFAPATADLKDIADGLVRLFCVADMFERIGGAT